MPPKESLKRKGRVRSDAGQTGRTAKRAKIVDARTIAIQSADKAVNEKGELDVAAFVKAREFEIKALEDAIRSSKHGLMIRAFQQVPRQLRRRTASHNVKKIPRRLRRRAEKEIKEDNTPVGSERKKDLSTRQVLKKEHAKKAAKQGARARAQREALIASQVAEGEVVDAENHEDALAVATVAVNKGSEAPASIIPINPPQGKKNALVKAPKPVTKFRKRQKEKIWLPSHIFHAKRAHMTSPAHPLWGFCIPLSPTERVYRITHRAANLRGCIAWDTSYMSTVAVEGTINSVLGALRALGIPESMLIGKQGIEWRDGLKTWDGWLMDKEKPERLISPATIVWRPFSDKEAAGSSSASDQVDCKRKVFIRTHPAGFPDFWTLLLKSCKMQRPQASIRDLRYDIGSIEIEGPAAAEALAGILRPLETGDHPPRATKISHLLQTMAAITNPSALKANVLIHLNTSDPRLHHPPRRLDKSNITQEDIIQLQTKWPSEDVTQQASLFDDDARFASCRLQASQRSINKRIGAAGPGEYPKDELSDPRVPAMLFTHTSRSTTRQQHGSWILLLPWHWVLPMWHSLMYFPLSTGSTPLFGGLQERHQLSFEYSEPFYPADFPGTSVGQAWEESERKKRRKEWEGRPKGKRVEWSSLDLGLDLSGGGSSDNKRARGEIGLGWACDWERLVASSRSQPCISEYFPSAENKTAKKGDTSSKKSTPIRERRATSSSSIPPPDRSFSQVLATQLRQPNYVPKNAALLTVRIIYVQRGVPATCARIYRLPETDLDLRKRWLTLIEKGDEAKGKAKGEAKGNSTAVLVTQENEPIKASSGKKKAMNKAVRDDKSHQVETSQNQSDETHADGSLSLNSTYPPVPVEQDLIGFITTGNYNLGEGKGTGIGAIVLRKIWPPLSSSAAATEDKQTTDKSSVDSRLEGLCIVRNAGSVYGRLARWEAAA